MSTGSIPESIPKYNVIREYLNLYGLEEAVKHIIRHHIKNTFAENLPQKHTSQTAKNYAKQDDD